MDHIHINQNNDSYRDEKIQHDVKTKLPSLLHVDGTEESRKLPCAKGKGRLNSDYLLEDTCEKISPVDKRHHNQNTTNEDYFSYPRRRPNSSIHQSSPLDSPLSFRNYNQLSSPSSLPSLRSPLPYYNSMRNYPNTTENEISHQRHRRVSETGFHSKDNIINMLPPIQFSKTLVGSKLNDDDQELSPSRQSNLTLQLHGNTKRQTIEKKYNSGASLTLETR